MALSPSLCCQAITLLYPPAFLPLPGVSGVVVKSTSVVEDLAMKRCVTLFMLWTTTMTVKACYIVYAVDYHYDCEGVLHCLCCNVRPSIQN